MPMSKMWICRLLVTTPILANFASLKAQNRTNRRAAGLTRARSRHVCITVSPLHWRYLFVCLFVCLFCVFVRLRISPTRIKLAASNFARWFMGVLGRESPILANFASPKAKKSDESVTNPELKFRMGRATVIACLSISREVCGRRIGRFRRRTYLLEIGKVWIY